MTNADLYSGTNPETSKPSDYSFEHAVIPENVPAYGEQESVQKPQRKRSGRSAMGDLLAAFAILAAAIMGTLGINSEMVIHHFPNVAAALHLSVPLQDAAFSAGANADIKVWVDLKTGLYYCPGANSYGHTRSGRYLKQADARLANFEPAERKGCLTQAGPMLPGEGVTRR